MNRYLISWCWVIKMDVIDVVMFFDFAYRPRGNRPSPLKLRKKKFCVELIGVAPVFWAPSERRNPNFGEPKRKSN